MWVVAAVLLGSVVLGALAGLHVGPHGHALAAIAGAVAAAWLIFMASNGRGGALLFSLIVADVAVSAGLGLLAWKGLTNSAAASRAGTTPHGAIGVAVGDLDPFGVVRVRGEEWSAESLNGRIASGSAVQVIGHEGVRLQVWDEEGALLPRSVSCQLASMPGVEIGTTGSEIAASIGTTESEEDKS